MAKGDYKKAQGILNLHGESPESCIRRARGNDADDVRHELELAQEHISALEAERDATRRTLEDALVEMYLSQSPARVAVAGVCDEILDRSGALLGRIRNRVYERKDKERARKS